MQNKQNWNVSYKSPHAKLIYFIALCWYVFEVGVNYIARSYTLLFGWLPSSFVWLNVCLFSGLGVGYLLIYKVGNKRGL